MTLQTSSWAVSREAEAIQTWPTIKGARAEEIGGGSEGDDGSRHVCEILSQGTSQKMLAIRVEEVATGTCRPLPLERPVFEHMTCLTHKDYCVP
jgi:hypothetical protein